MDGTATLKRTPLHAAHVKLGARMTAFGGWEMPLQFSGIVEEHRAVRQRVGLFDISHMGEFLVAGPHAQEALNRLLTNDVRKIEVGQAQYTLLCNERGGIIDDLIAYRLEPSVYLLIVNAGNIEKDFAWMNARAPVPVVLENRSDKMAALALQGPRAAELLGVSTALARFHIERQSLFGQKCWVARTGYTGEDGFEIFCEAAEVAGLWTELLERGAQFGLRPCGLGARDTLRLEMGYPLHGSDLTEQSTPLEAGLGKFVSLDKGDFIGREALVRQKESGVARRLVALKMNEKAPPPRPHYAILSQGRKVGALTSGTQSPSLGVGIGMGYVETAAAQPGLAIEIEIRGKRYAGMIVKKPILKRS